MITSGGSGTGNGTISYTVAANNLSGPRNTTITVGTLTHTINQAAFSCSFSVSPPSRSFSSGGGTGDVTVAAGSSCGWTATDSEDWITITSGANGTGIGTVNYTVASNTSPNERTGQINVQGEVHTITQSGVPCTLNVSPAGAAFQVSGGTGTVGVTANCSWTAVSNASWLAVTSGATGSGNGQVGYRVEVNSGQGSRSGRITVNDKFFDVTQAAGPVITAVFVDGKNLIVQGFNFSAGAKVFMDGTKQKTKPDESNPSTRLIVKKGAKKIGAGQTVGLQVRNADDAMSPVFSFTKPGAASLLGVRPRVLDRKGRPAPAPRRVAH
jgi:hypothetical protein